MALVAALAILCAACGPEAAAPVQSVTTTTRPQSLASAMGRLPPATVGQPDAEDEVEDTESQDARPPVTQPPETTVPVTLVSREQFEEQLPDIGYVQRCIETGAAYAKLHLLALDGAQGAREATGSAGQFRAFLPPALHGEIDAVTAAIAQVAREGPLDSTALETPAYDSSNATLAAYFDNGCPP